MYHQSLAGESVFLQRGEARWEPKQQEGITMSQHMTNAWVSVPAAKLQ